MTRAILLLVAVLASGCAARLDPPVVQAYTAILWRGDALVTATTVTEIWPFLTINCRQARDYALVSTAACADRVFRFVSLDRRERTATYRELTP